MSEAENSPKPGACLSQPLAETGVDAFLAAHPKFDGRGTIIAVLDTGVDPAADGLKATPDGRRKVIELCDCTGGGDVDTSTVVRADDGVLMGLSGRRLQVPAAWANPSGDFHVGLKSVFELCSPELKSRLKKLRKERLWDAPAREALAAAHCAVLAHEAAVGKAPEGFEERLERDELVTRVDALKDLYRDYEDLGPVADCVVFFDGQGWNLVDADLLGVFHDTGDYSKLNLMTYSVNIHDDGNLLEIVVPSNSHGTHVASVAAAHHPNDTTKDGVAPGAQVVSMLIGDPRHKNMVCSVIKRALAKCVALGVDVINLSFGSAAAAPNVGRLVEAIEEAVWKHGILFVASSGNDGPALSVVDAPGGTSDACLGFHLLNFPSALRHVIPCTPSDTVHPVIPTIPCTPSVSH